MPLNDTIPESVPSVPLRGTKSAPLSALLAWRAEIDIATLECSNAAADVDAATFATATTKQALTAAVAMNNAATTQESNAKARSSIALKRRRFAWKCYLELLAAVSSNSCSPTPSIASAPPPPDENGDAREPSSDAEDGAGDFNNEVFEGLLVNLQGAGEFGGLEADAMDLA